MAVGPVVDSITPTICLERLARLDAVDQEGFGVPMTPPSAHDALDFDWFHPVLQSVSSDVLRQNNRITGGDYTQWGAHCTNPVSLFTLVLHKIQLRGGWWAFALEVLTQLKLLSPQPLLSAKDGTPFSFLVTCEHTLAVKLKAIGTFIHAFKDRRRGLTHHWSAAAWLPGSTFQALYLQELIPDFSLCAFHGVVARFAFISADGAHVMVALEAVRQEQVGIRDHRGNITFQLAVGFGQRPEPIFQTGQPPAQSLKLGGRDTGDGAAF